jgi:hypothetical protein
MRSRRQARMFGAWAALVSLSTGCATHFADETQKAIKDAYQTDMSLYTFRGTPVGRFGAGTMYTNDLADAQTPADQRWLIGEPTTWFRSTVSEADQKALLVRIIVPGDLGSADLTKNVSTKLGLEAVVPAIKQVVSGGASLDYSKGVKVTLKASKATNRRVNYTELIAAAKANKMTDGVTKYLNDRDYIIGAADIVLEGYAADISIDQSVNPSLNAKLEQLAGTSADAGTVKLTITKKASGEFKVAAGQPVIAAVNYKTPPQTEQNAADDYMKGWRTIKVSNTVLAPLDSLLGGTR